MLIFKLAMQSEELNSFFTLSKLHSDLSTFSFLLIIYNLHNFFYIPL